MNKAILTALKTAQRSMARNKVRTSLTMLGIVIGIAAVIVVFAAGDWLRDYVVSQVTQFGTDYIEVEIKVPNTSQTSSANATGIAQGISITTLKERDAEAISRHPNVTDVYAAMLGQELVSYRDERKTVLLWGANASYIDIDPGELDYGRFFTDEEDKSLAQVAVLGSAVAEDLFGDQDPIGERLSINQQKYEIIGVMQERGGGGVISLDDMVFLPLKTLQKR